MRKLPVLMLLSSFFITALHAANLPDFSLQDINGAQFQIRDQIGKKNIVITFWATWCSPCKQLLTRLEKMRQKYPDLSVVAISVDDSTTLAGVRPYISGKKFGFSVLLDTDSRVIKMFDPEKKVPITILADKTGRIVYSRMGYLPGDEKEIQKILEGRTRE